MEQKVYKEPFEIKLNFVANSGSAERVYLAMAAYVSAFESVTTSVGRAIDAELNYSYTLSDKFSL